ncbi:hypothetical protein ACLOJK_041494 [Asimina triloba]
MIRVVHHIDHISPRLSRPRHKPLLPQRRSSRRFFTRMSFTASARAARRQCRCQITSPPPPPSHLKAAAST